MSYADEMTLSDRQFRLLAEALPQIVWAADGQGQCEYVNRRWCEYTGLTLDASLGYKWSESVHPADRQASLERWSQAARNSQPYEFEYRIRRADGAYRWFLVRAEPMLDDEDVVVRWFGTATDIEAQKQAERAALLNQQQLLRLAVTERREVEQQLRASEEHYRLTAEVAQGLIYEWDARTNLVYRSPGLFPLLGFYPDEVPLSRDWWISRIHPEDLPLALQATARAQQEGEQALAEYRVQHRDGRWVYVRDRSLLVRDARGDLARVIGNTVDITERRQAEQRLETVLASIDDHLVCFDHDWRFTYVNDGAARILGRAKAELLGACIWELFPEAVGNQYYRELHAAVRERRIICSEHYYAPFDRWFENHIYPSTDGVTVFSSDITARKQAERALRESEERFRTLADTAPTVLWITDETGACTFLSRGWYEYTGQQESEALGTGWTEPVHPDDRERASRVFGEAIARRESFALDYRLRRADGEYRWAIDSARPRFGPDGQFLGHIGSVIDVHERTLAEQTLRDSEERFRTLADNMSQFAWMADPQGWIFWYNQRWYDYTGTTLQEMQGWGWTKVHHPDHIDRVVSKIQRAWDTGEAWEDVFPLRSKEGGYRWFLSRAVPIRDDQGRILRWFGTNTDVTEQRAAEAALKDEHRRKDEFLAMLAHELRNPLGPIRNAAHVLRLAAITDGIVCEARDVIERQVTHMARLVDELLDMSRISSGRIHLRRQHCDLAAIVRQTVDDYRHTVLAGELTLHVELPAQPVWVHGDPTRLAQAASNLLHNAVKFTDKGGHIAVSMHAESGQAIVTVQDTGIGIDAQTAANLFQPFVQAERSLDRSRGGLGLGLALVKGLMELHGGGVAAYSEGPGRGARISIYLPLAEQPSPAEAEQGERQDNGGKLRILIIEDNHDAARSLKQLLVLSGHDVSLAFDGPTGVDLARQLRPDVVLCDIGLPRGMDGYAVARTLRAEPRLSAVRLIALTGYGQEEDVRLTKAAGFDQHLVKPAEYSALLAALAEVRA